MFGSHFKQASVAGKERASEDDERDGHGQQYVQRPPSLRPSFERGVTTAVSTPHDVVLAELFSHRPVPEVIEVVSARSEAETSRRAQSPSRTPLHDPFAGSLIGLSVPDDGDHAQSDPPNVEASKEDLWSHMGNIKDIQTQIANMHVAMENIGLGHQADQLAVERVHSTVASEGEKWGDTVEGEDDEVKEKDAREQEFTKLANKFHGRKEATENIMTKLDELSRVVTAFHASRIPAVDVCGSRPGNGAEEAAVVDAPLIAIPPPREQQQQQHGFLQGPVPMRVGNLGEKAGS